MTVSLLTPPAIGKRLGIKADRVRELIRNGELRAVDLARRGSRRPRYRISPDDLADFLQARTVRPPPARAPRRRRKQVGTIEFF